jgi:phage shock protein PspC (stress-responsive transcriptional regulator)
MMGPMDTETSTPPPTAGPPPSSARRVRRAREGRVVAGVCEGLGRSFDIDPVIFRVVFPVLVLAGGSGLLLYLLAWAGIPEEGRDTSLVEDAVGRGRPVRGLARWLPVLPFLLAGLFLLGMIGGPGGPSDGLALAVVAVVAFWLWQRRPDGDPRPTPPPVPPPAAPSPPTGGSWAASGQAPLVAPAPPEVGVTGATSAAGAAPGPDPDLPAAPPPPAAGVPSPEAPPMTSGDAAWSPAGGPPHGTPGYGAAAAGDGPWHGATPTATRRPSLGGLTASTLAVAAGVALSLNLGGLTQITLQAFLAGAILFVGVALVLATWFGRSGGLVLLGTALVVAFLVVSTTAVPVSGGAGERTWRPVGAEELRSEYRLGAGDALLDLSDVDDLPAGTSRVEVRLGAGELRVVVPDDTTVEVDARAGIGEVVVLDRTENGLGVRSEVVDRQDGSPRLVLDTRVGLGRVEVTRATS